MMNDCIVVAPLETNKERPLKRKRYIRKQFQNTKRRRKPTHDELPLLDSHRKYLWERTCSQTRKLNGFEAVIDLIKKKEGMNRERSLMLTIFKSTTSDPTYGDVSLEHLIVKGRRVPTVFRSYPLSRPG
jgi:hypothetical protein